MVELGCLVCGEIINMPSYIDTEKYDGQVTCQKCGSLFHIKLVSSKVQGYKVVDKKFKNFNGSEVREKLLKKLEEMGERAKGK